MLEGLSHLFKDYFGVAADSIMPLRGHASDRRRFRLSNGKSTAIGVVNENRAENQAFITYARHFLKVGLHVPKIYKAQLSKHIYLEQDLGDTTLYDTVLKDRINSSVISEEVRSLYREAVRKLPHFQIRGGRGLDYSVAYPRKSFDPQSMRWDLNYFKYNFLRLQSVPFNEEKLESDFNRLIAFLDNAPANYFLYRDFQSRNIMVTDSELYFIDFQGGRHGALQYDLASLLYQAKVGLSRDRQEELIEVYLKELNTIKKISSRQFMKFYPGFALIRILQNLGTYGEKGLLKRKGYFIDSIAPAVINLVAILKDQNRELKLPEISTISSRLTERFSSKLNLSEKMPFTVQLRSFSYRNGLPHPASKHGGGFVFDCRALPNPGRLDGYKTKSGLDHEVKEYLADKAEVQSFFESCKHVVESSLKNYLSRNFDSLEVYFGCTGGQHRSVYCTERLKEELMKKYDIMINVKHLDLEEIK